MRTRRTFAALALLAVVLLSATGCSGSEPGPGETGFDPLAASSPAEVVARTVRLAGYEQMVVTPGRNDVHVWLRLPALNSAADVEIAWQTGVAALAEGFPGADEYQVSIATDAEHLSVAVPGKEARDAISSDDAAALREAAVFEYLLAQGDAREVPEGSYVGVDDVILRYLDQKNRSNGLVGDEGLLFAAGPELVREAARIRESVPGVPAVEPGADSANVWAERARALLSASVVANAEELARSLSGDTMARGGDDASAMRETYHVVSAVESDEAYGSVLGLVAQYAKLTRDSEVTSGPRADAVLVAYHDPTAPTSARDIAEFTRVPTADTGGGGDTDLLPDLVIEANGGEGAVIAYMTSSGTHVVETDAWLAYDREDGTRYWLAGEEGQVALTDGSLLGWAFERREAALVDAAEVGIWREVFPTQ